MRAGSIGLFQALSAENGWVMSGVSCFHPVNSGIAASGGNMDRSVRREIILHCHQDDQYPGKERHDKDCS